MQERQLETLPVFDRCVIERELLQDSMNVFEAPHAVLKNLAQLISIRLCKIGNRFLSGQDDGEVPRGRSEHVPKKLDPVDSLAAATDDVEQA